MTDILPTACRSRREFLWELAACGGAALTAARFGDVLEARSWDWKNQIGLELYTVRDQLAGDYPGVLAKVAAMGYREIEPAGGYNNMSPTLFRSMLDRLGLTMPAHIRLPAGLEPSWKNSSRDSRSWESSTRRSPLRDGAAGQARRPVDVLRERCRPARISTRAPVSSTMRSLKPRRSDRISRQCR
jgi:hypothetical protein